MRRTHTHTHTHIHTEVHIRRYEQHIQTHAQGAMTRGKEDVSVFRINISIKKVQSIFRLSMCAVYNGEVHDSFFFFSFYSLYISDMSSTMTHSLCLTAWCCS